MTKFTKITLLTLVSFLLFTGCGTSEKNNSSSKKHTVETKQSVEKTSSTSSQSSTQTSASTNTTEASTATESSSSSSSEETSTKSTTTPNSSSSETTNQEATANTIVIDVNEFISKYDSVELDTSLTYQFEAEPTAQELWGFDSDGEYTIDIKGEDYDFLLLTTPEVANSIKNSKSVTFTVRVDTTSTTYLDPVRVISATPKP